MLLEKLETEKLQAAADELATRWKWAVAMIKVEWSDTARYGLIEPQPADRTPEEQAEIEKLEARRAELAELDDEDWTQKTLTETESIETRLDEIEGGRRSARQAAPRGFRDGGCIVTIAHDGTLQVIQGLVKPEDMPKQTEPGDAARRLSAATTPIPPQMALTLPRGPCPPPWRCPRTARPRRARKWASVSGWPTISVRSGRRSSRPISPGTSRPLSTSCCSRWGVRCSSPMPDRR